MLFCHGNAGNVALWGDELRILHDRMRVAAWVSTTAAYGRSEGTPSEAGVLADARAARRWLARRTGIAENQIVLMGDRWAGPWPSTWPWTAPAAWSWKALSRRCPRWPCRAALAAGAVGDADAIEFVGQDLQYHGPILQSHGTADRLIPFAMGKQLFAAANEPKRFVLIPGGDHNDPQTEEYYAALFQFSDF